MIGYSKAVEHEDWSTVPNNFEGVVKIGHWYCWIIEGKKLHCLEHEAFIKIFINGGAVGAFYIEGEHIEKENFPKEVLKYKLNRILND